MIVRTNIRHRAEILPKRARKVRRAFLTGPVSTLLRETTAAEAPVVLRHAGSEEEQGHVDVRLHDGLLWDIRRTAGADREDQPPGGRIVSSHADVVARHVQQWADEELLVVDGVVHGRARSPVLDIVDVAMAYWNDAALRLMDVRTVPAWFAVAADGTAMRDALASLPSSDSGMYAERIRRLLDVEIVDADLLVPLVAESALHSDMGPEIGNAVEHLRRGSRSAGRLDPAPPHASSTSAGDDRLGRILEWVATAAVRGRSSYADACRAVSEVFAPPTARDPSGTVDSPSKDVPTRMAVVVYAKGATSPGWAVSGRGQAAMDVAVPVVDPGAYGRVAGIDGLEVLHGPSGFLAKVRGCAFSVERDGDGRGRVGNVHAGTLADAAFLIGGGGETKPFHAFDYIGGSLGRRRSDPAIADADRENLLHVFVSERVVDLDGLTCYRCPEPLILVAPDAPAWRRRIDVDVSHARRRSPGGLPPFAFRMDRRGDALAFAEGFPWMSPAELPAMDVVDASPFVFDADLWNLRAAMWRIVEEVDARIVLLPPDVVAGIGRIAVHVRTWILDASLVGDAGMEDDFVSDCGMLLAELPSPLLDDIGGDWVRGMADASLANVVEARRGAAPDDREDDSWLGMSL